MEHIEAMIRLADKEMGAIEQNGKFRSREEIDSVYKLMDIVKDAYCIMEMEEDDYSEDGGYPDRGYHDGVSYARGRGRNARRDAMGRYSSDGYNRNYDDGYRGNYRRGGYSRDDAKEEYRENLRRAMEEAPDEQTRMSIQRMMEQI